MRHARLVFVLLCSLAAALDASAQPASRRSFETLRSRERSLADPTTASLATLRKQVTAWEAFVRRYPVSGYADDALWAAAELAATIGARTGADADRQRAAKYFHWLAREYPASDKVKPALARAAALEAPSRSVEVPARAGSAPAGHGTGDTSRPATSPRQTATRGVLPPPTTSGTTPAASVASARTAATGAKSGAAPSNAAAGVARLTEVRRTILPELVRVTIELDDEVAFTHERIEGPARVFFDIKNASAVTTLQDRVLSFNDDVVKHIRVGRRPGQATRVVLDLDGVGRYSVFTLYAPYRIVVDLEREAGPLAVRPGVSAPSLIEQWEDAPAAPSPAPTTSQAKASPPVVPPPPAGIVADSRPAAAAGEVAAVSSSSSSPSPAPSAPRSGPASAPPSAPATNASGGFSLARQLGLGVSRVVIDPGHGGHDPGALGKRVTEAELVLDVSLRLEKMLAKAGVAVVMTRRSDDFIPLEERTAIANRERADLFLSIHANASRNAKANGVETYFLNFASNPAAEAVAARENSASGQSMHILPDIVRAIALNNKLDESRDFAHMVQESMIRKLRNPNKQVRDLGVKQAPFVVLIGAGMPSVLAEIAFVTHPQEGQLLRTNAYRQHIADALFEAVNRYIKSLKSVGTVASQD